MRSRTFGVSLILPLLLAAACLPLQAEASTQVQLKQLRFLPAGETTRIVLELNGKPDDLTVQDTPGVANMSLSFNGTLSPSLQKAKSHIKTFPYSNLKQVYYEERQGKVQIFIKRALVNSVKVTPTEQPGQISLNAPNHIVYSRDQVVAPGVRHTKIVKHVGRGPILVNVLEIDPKTPGLEVLPGMATSTMGHNARVSTIATSHQAIAGINGSFFKQDKGIPLGILIKNYELIAGPIYNRVALGIGQDNQLSIDRVALRGEITLPDDVTVLPLDTINQPRVKLNQTVLYTARWGKSAPPVPSDGYQVALRNGHVSAVSTGEPLAIPSDGVVVSGPYSPALEKLAQQPDTALIKTTFHTTPDWSGMKHAIGGGPFLVKDGQVYIDVYAQNFTTRSLGTYEPRSAAGITRDGKLLLVTVDGRQSHVSVGLSLKEMAGLMQSLGAVQAMNLDGGSSTQMVVNGRLVNSPSIRNGAAVSNGLLVRKSTSEPDLAAK